MEQHNFRSLYRDIRLLAGLLCLLTPVSVRADTAGDSKAPAPALSERCITLTRIGRGQAHPDQLTIDFPFTLQGESWAEVDKKHDLLQADWQGAIAPYGSSANTVSIPSLQKGGTVQGGKPIPCETGIVCVSVRDLSHWKELLLALAKRSATPLVLNYHVTEGEALRSAMEQAQKSAILQARKDADRLASIAGTRVVGVQVIREGCIRNAPSTASIFEKSGDNLIPPEIPAMDAEITVTFELAPPASGKATSQKSKKPGH